VADQKDKKIKLTAIEPILHDGVLIKPGEEFEADKNQADTHQKNKTAGKK